MNPSTSDTTTSASSANTSGGLFRTADGKSLVFTFVLITSLFLLWGFFALYGATWARFSRLDSLPSPS